MKKILIIFLLLFSVNFLSVGQEIYKDTFVDLKIPIGLFRATNIKGNEKQQEQSPIEKK